MPWSDWLSFISSAPVSLMVRICLHLSLPALGLDTVYIYYHPKHLAVTFPGSNGSLKGKYVFRKKEEGR